MFVFYLFLGLLTSIVSFAQDYTPIRDNKEADTGSHESTIKTVSRYGVASLRIRMKDLSPKETRTNETEEAEKYGDPWKENEEDVDAYGVIASEEDLKEDNRTFKEKTSTKDYGEMLGAYGVALPNEDLKDDKTKK